MIILTAAEHIILLDIAQVACFLIKKLNNTVDYKPRILKKKTYKKIKHNL
jgi:hypothetical protein